MASQTDFATWVRNISTALLNASGDGRNAIKHYQGLDYATPANLTTEEIRKVHPDVSREDIVAAVVSMDAIEAFIDAGGHRTNLEKVRRLLT